MIRGAVVGLINNKSLSQLPANYEDGRAVTLISSDAENVCQSARFFHETWAHVIEVIVGMAMLAREVGWLCPVPLVIIFCRCQHFEVCCMLAMADCVTVCSRMSRYLAKNLQSKQKSWSVATQNRLAMTASMLAAIKSLKMLGTTPYTEALIQNLRLKELEMAKKVRWMMVAYNASGMHPNSVFQHARVIELINFSSKRSWHILSNHHVRTICVAGNFERLDS